MLSGSGSLVLGCALVTPVLSALLPRDPLSGYGDFAQGLVARDGESWAPPGAPPMHPGQSVEDYINNIMSGTGEPQNPLPTKEKRDYTKNQYNTSTQWTENDVTYKITVVDGHCDNGVKPSTVVGPLTAANGQETVNATMSDIIYQLYLIRKMNADDVVAREVAYAQLMTKNAAEAYAGLIEILDHGWICQDETNTGSLAIHDELRRKLLEMTKIQYYSALLTASVATGATIAGIQAGVTHGFSNVELGTEAYINSAIGIACTLFAATEFSRFAPRVAAAEAYSPLTLLAWTKRFVNESRQKSKLRGSTGAFGGGAASSLVAAAANAGSGGSGGPPCVPRSAAGDGAESLMERGLNAGSAAAMSALDLGWNNGGSESANIGAGTSGVGAACH